MPRTISSNVYVIGESAFSPKRSEKDEEKFPALTLNQGSVTADEKLTPAEVDHVEKPTLKLPLLPTSKGLSNEDKNDLQVLLRVRRFGFPPRSPSLTPEWNKSSDTKSTFSSDSQRSQLRFAEKDGKDSCESSQSSDKEILKEKNNFLPLLSFSTVLEGQRLNLQGKELNKQRRKKGKTTTGNKFPYQTDAKSQENDKQRKQQAGTTTGNKFPYQTDTKSQESSTVFEKTETSNTKLKFQTRNNLVSLCKQRKQQGKTTRIKFSYQTDTKSQEPCSIGFEKTKPSSTKLNYQTPSNMVSFKFGKHDGRPVFHQSKADEYNITPGGNHTSGKVCRVFRLNDLKTSLIYSGYKDSWVPSRDKYFTTCSVFKAIMQQPTVFLRQPSPVAGVKMTLQEHGDSLAAAIHAVEETNVPSPPADDELTQNVMKFVIRLPPIC